MVRDTSQISAIISGATKEQFDRFSERHGLKKNFVIEQALLLFMQARRSLPDEAFIPSRIVVANESFDRTVERSSQPASPTSALRELLRET